MTKSQAKFVAQELRRLAPMAPRPDGTTTVHAGRRAYLDVANELDEFVVNKFTVPKIVSEG